MIHERKLDIGVERSSVAPGNLSDWYAQSKSFAAFVAFRNEDFDLQGNGSPELYTGVYRHRGLLRCAGRMIIILNGPLGIGKSTLAEALADSIEQCVMLDGDHLIVANPLPADVCAALAKNRVDCAALPI